MAAQRSMLYDSGGKSYELNQPYVRQRRLVWAHCLLATIQLHQFAVLEFERLKQAEIEEPTTFKASLWTNQP